MATDATGTPTPKGIPKFDTANDAPSGLGFNATMDAIDLLLNKAQFSTDAAVTGEVPVWNGSAWVYDKIDPDQIKQDGATANQVLTWNGTQWAPATPAAAGTVQTYTPSWTASGTAPSLGDGTLVGRFIQIGKLVLVNVKLTAGSTTTFGTGTWFISLPTTDNAAVSAMGGAFFNDSGTTFYGGPSRQEAGGQKISLWFGSTTLATVGPTVPFTWATGDILNATLAYEAA